MWSITTLPNAASARLTAPGWSSNGGKRYSIACSASEHRRFHMHFTPTSSSWINQVERFFGRITTDRIRRGVFKSVAELEATIQNYLERHNANPKPFVWTKSAADILEKVARGRQVLESVH